MEAFQLADSIRYIDDTKYKLKIGARHLETIENELALSSIKITKELTPELQITVNEVCKNLFLDVKKVNAYITSALEINAGCINDSSDKCVITLTSPLVNLLTTDELNFVIGHEIGHFLLNHCIEDWVQDSSQESLIKKRAQEISCDRVGLIACKSFDVSIKSIVKSLSGLSGKHLTYNIRSLLDQLEDINPDSNSLSQFSSHPAFLLRVKALLRFSLSDKYLSLIGDGGGTPIQEVDKLIQTDLNKYVDSRIRDEISIYKDNIFFWGYVYAFVSDGKFTKEEQQIISSKFGLYKQDQLNKMLKSIGSKTKVINEIKEKLTTAINKFREIAPNNSNNEINKILNDIEKDTNKNNLFTEIIRGAI